MGYSIRVAAQVPRERASEFFLEKNFDSLEAFDEAKKLCDNKKRIGFFESLVIPVRTDNLTNFSKDFFFPTLVNHALKIDNIVLKLIASIVCAALDICTLPIRAITAIPRYFYNAAHPKETHPLYQYLKQNGVKEENLTAGHVYLEMQRPEQATVHDLLNHVTRQEEKLVREGETFNFVELPATVSNIDKVSGWILGKDYSLPYFL